MYMFYKLIFLTLKIALFFSVSYRAAIGGYGFSILHTTISNDNLTRRLLFEIKSRTTKTNWQLKAFRKHIRTQMYRWLTSGDKSVFYTTEKNIKGSEKQQNNMYGNWRLV